MAVADNAKPSRRQSLGLWARVIVSAVLLAVLVSKIHIGDLLPEQRQLSTVAFLVAGLLITGLTGHWWPDQVAWPGIELAGGVLVVVALSLLGSVVLSSTANGIAVFMLFGAGLVAGLLGSIGHALNSHTIKHASAIASWALPFEALYQDGLRMITEHASGLTGFLLQLGPFGGAYVHGWGIRVWAVAYVLIVGAVALVSFARKNL